MTTFSIGQVEVMITPELDVVAQIAEEMLRNLSSLLPRELQDSERADVMAIICDGLYRAQNDVIRRATKDGDYPRDL